MSNYKKSVNGFFRRIVYVVVLISFYQCLKDNLDAFVENQRSNQYKQFGMRFEVAIAYYVYDAQKSNT